MLSPAAEPDFELPSCYKHIPQRLQPGHLTKFKEETLFYIFYR
jgi:CCR4-NOT transcription complex subunit 2